jgi:hypothetical protein
MIHEKALYFSVADYSMDKRINRTVLPLSLARPIIFILITDFCRWDLSPATGGTPVIFHHKVHKDHKGGINSNNTKPFVFLVVFLVYSNLGEYDENGFRVTGPRELTRGCSLNEAF